MLRRSAILLAVFAVACPALADVKLPAVLSNHMVLQRETNAPLWGTAEAGEKIAVKLGEQSVSATADAAGKWLVKLPPQKAGGPHTISITGNDAAKKIELTDVMFGEVWLASGQSNMHWTFSHNIKDKEQELSNSDDPWVRQFTVQKKGSSKPESDTKGAWLAASRDNLLVDATNGASAVGYLFARELRRQLDVPVGVINSSVGGTPIESWSPGGVLYNGLIAPVAPYGIRGALWYQGESNCLTGQGMKYVDLQQRMVAAWRELWGQGDFSFYFVQIAPFIYSNRPKMTVESLPEFWQAQTTAMKTVPRSGMVVISDLVDNVKDIHPSNKQDVAKRLAGWALAKDYGRSNLVYSGPMFQRATVEGGAMRVAFEQVGTGLASRDGKPLSHFLVAGEDKQFHPAEATIEGAAVVVRSDKVAKPVAVRFAWREDAMPNLMNKEGLPANSFRSDDWPLSQ